jgi:hypothetical protein
MTAMIEHVPYTGFNALPDRRQMRRVAAGIAISLAAHALLLAIYRQPQSSALPAATRETLTVRLQAAPTRPPKAEPVRPAPQYGTQGRERTRSGKSGDGAGTPAAAALADRNQTGTGHQGSQAAGLQGRGAGRSAGTALPGDGQEGQRLQMVAPL